VLVLLAGPFAPVSAAEKSAAAAPNIVVILADDLGFSDLGCYGGEIDTPNLDRLAAGGLRFTQFYNTARCWPSRAALLTGYYAQQVRRDTLPGIKSGGQAERPAWAPLLPQMLQPLGYHSYHSGKWHVDGRILAGGFERSYALEDHNRLFAPLFHTRDDQPLDPIRLAAGKTETGYYATTAIADHAIECLRQHQAQQPTAPFFSYIAFTVPHFPLHAPQADIDKYRKRYREGWNVAQAVRGRKLQELGIVRHVPPAMERELGPPYPFPKDVALLGSGEVDRPLPWNELTPEQQAFQAEKMAIHAAMVDRMDQEIGRVIAELEKLGRFENTLILFASDNGASAEMMVRGDGHDAEAPRGSGASFLCLGPGWSSVANTPFRRHKTWVHEGGISTPLVAHWPKGIAARGGLRHDPTHLIDVVPTVLEIAGGKRLTEWQGTPVPPAPGKSLVPAFAKDGSVQHKELWWLHEGNRALRAGDWKIVAAGPKGDFTAAPWELYNLAEDRGETNNLAVKMPEKVEELAERWEAQYEDARRLASQGANLVN
jgi:arylsulfatase